jgi:hypothetical protein
LESKYSDFFLGKTTKFLMSHAIIKNLDKKMNGNDFELLRLLSTYHNETPVYLS